MNWRGWTSEASNTVFVKGEWWITVDKTKASHRQWTLHGPSGQEYPDRTRDQCDVLHRELIAPYFPKDET